VDGGRRTANKRQENKKKIDGGRQTADGGWRTADGGRRTTDGGQTLQVNLKLEMIDKK